jgi:hypothetical protein
MNALTNVPARGVTVKKLSLHDFYTFGRAMPVLFWLKYDSKILPNLSYIVTAQGVLKSMLKDESPLLEPARRAARKLLALLYAVVPDDVSKWSAIKEDDTLSWHSSSIVSALNELESVLSNDMPGISAYLVRRKGIFDTEALIDHPERHLDDDGCAILPAQAMKDLQAAGRGLAYELPTASAFHLWRAVETVSDFYYQHLTGQTFKEAGIQRTWNSYIVALKKNGADEAITSFLNFIRAKYRNPQTHPNVDVTTEQAKGLFSVATSVIDQTLAQIRTTQPKARLTPLAVTGPPEDEPLPEEDETPVQ